VGRVGRREGRRESRRSKKRLTNRPRALAVVQVPAVLARIVPVHVNSGYTFMLLEDLIAAHVGD